jgi:hypothetical protein
LGIDGEAVELAPSLEFVVRTAALRVRISSRHPGVSRSSLLVRSASFRTRPKPHGDRMG